MTAEVELKLGASIMTRLNLRNREACDERFAREMRFHNRKSGAAGVLHGLAQRNWGTIYWVKHPDGKIGVYLREELLA